MSDMFDAWGQRDEARAELREAYERIAEYLNTEVFFVHERNCDCDCNYPDGYVEEGIAQHARMQTWLLSRYPKAKVRL